MVVDEPMKSFEKKLKLYAIHGIHSVNYLYLSYTRAHTLKLVYEYSFWVEIHYIYIYINRCKDIRNNKGYTRILQIIQCKKFYKLCEKESWNKAVTARGARILTPEDWIEHTKIGFETSFFSKKKISLGKLNTNIITSTWRNEPVKNQIYIFLVFNFCCCW